jgi:hypothetical protein
MSLCILQIAPELTQSPLPQFLSARARHPL